MPSAANFGHAACGIEVIAPQHRIDLARSHTECLHLGQIEDDFDFAVHPPEPARLGHAVDGQQALGHRIINEPAELFDGHVIGFDRVDAEEAASDFNLLDARFQDAVRQAAANPVDRVLDFYYGVVGICADFEFHEGVGAAFAGG